ncbi:10227_t:CDS:2 [Acaulospora colombiana]|uniref:10227_t:CDS:1 n=1 Tax=Acaulospora colombiana TaxID=27376 RepID=A0ACA9MNR7_9GLOM|nr:10227_t:CDS:2 [Acaulospora colombiana]
MKSLEVQQEEEHWKLGIPREAPKGKQAKAGKLAEVVCLGQGPQHLTLKLTARQYQQIRQAAAAGATRFQRFMNHPAGLKDLQRPPEKLSVSQNAALACTGFIWVRYSMVITPINYSLGAVNFFVGMSGLTQLYRIWEYVYYKSPLEGWLLINLSAVTARNTHRPLKQLLPTKIPIAMEESGHFFVYTYFIAKILSLHFRANDSARDLLTKVGVIRVKFQ